MMLRPNWQPLARESVPASSFQSSRELFVTAQRLDPPRYLGPMGSHEPAGAPANGSRKPGTRLLLNKRVSLRLPESALAS
jgi:hypothetical protein